MTRAAELAYAAVATPVEGTLLTVARQTAEAVQARYAVPGARLDALVTVAREAAAASLARTPELLPQLRAAGVVDAGGRGLCVLLEALEAVVTGRVVAPAPGLLVTRDRSGLAAAREAGSDAFAYEVQFLLRDATAAAVGTLTSPAFKVERKCLNFLIGGGKYPGETCFDLLLDDKVVRTATGPNDENGGTEELEAVSWDVAEFAGRTVVLRAVDRRTGGWGLN